MATSSARETIAGLEAVDSDLHLTETESDILPYLEEPFDKLINASGQELTAGAYPDAGYIGPGSVGKVEPREVRTKTDVQEAMEMLGVAKAMITPGLNLALSVVHHDDLAVALASAYNEWLLDMILDMESDIHGALLISPKKPESAAEEIDDRAGESKFVSVMIPASGVVPPLGHNRYDPIYDAAEQAGFPIVMHPSSRAQMINFPHQWLWTNRYTDMKVASIASDFMFHLSTMLTNGVPVRYPDLDVVVEETGLGWIPYFLERYDHVYHGNEHDAPYFEKPPSEYIHGQFYFTSQPIEGISNPQYLCQILRLFKAEQNLMFASDYPHHDFDYTDELLKTIRQEFDDDEIQNIYSGTAKKVFRF